MDLFEGTWYLQAVDVEGNTVGTMRLPETEATTLRETLLHMRGTFDDVDSAGLPDILLEVLKSSLSSRMLTSEGLGLICGVEPEILEAAAAGENISFDLNQAEMLTILLFNIYRNSAK